MMNYQDVLNRLRDGMFLSFGDLLHGDCISSGSYR